MIRHTVMISSPYGSTMVLVFDDIRFFPKFEGVTASEGVEGGWVGSLRIGEFRPLSRRISETVHDTTKVTIDH